MATGYDRDALRALVNIANALEGIERALEYVVEQIAEEREGRMDPPEDNGNGSEPS